MSWPRRSKPSGGWLGDSWLAFSQWLSRRLGRSGRAGIQLEAWQGLMRQHGLSRYGLGLIVHGLWLLALVAAALTWIGLTLVRRYEFVWETTLLETSQVGVVVQALSAWPSLLGISLPDPQVMRTTAAGDTLGPQGQRQWALWLLGNVLAYGLLPRALCLLGCAWAWRAGQARLALDPSEPGYHALVPALMPAHQSLGIIDADPGRGAARHPAPGPAGEGAWVLGFELAPDTPWPPMLPEGVVNAGLVDDSTQRRRILERLAARPAARVLVVCDQARSPDRGTLSFLRQLSQVAGAVRVYLAPSATEASATVASTTGADLADQAAAPVLPDAERQADWQAALQAQGMQPVDDWPAAWLTGTAT